LHEYESHEAKEKWLPLALATAEAGFLLQLSDSSRPGNPSAWLFINEDCALVTE
jgi:hypothetical protein